MPIHRCPGMAPGFFKPSDVKVRKCIHCSYNIEFWKDDVRITCPSCGQKNFNPNIGNTCLVWCKKAAECLGNDDIIEWMKREGNQPPPTE